MPPLWHSQLHRLCQLDLVVVGWRLGAWGCARQVGWALRRLPLPSEVPWQRVVNAKGQISMTLSRQGTDWMQRELLLEEGIPVDHEGRLPLRQVLWRPDASCGD